MATVMELLSKAVPIVMLAFVVSSMLAVGASLTVMQILDPLRNRKLVGLSLLANFLLMPIGAMASWLRANIAAARVVGGKGFDDSRVLVMVIVVAVVGLVILMPLARVFGSWRAAERA